MSVACCTEGDLIRNFAIKFAHCTSIKAADALGQAPVWRCKERNCCTCATSATISDITRYKIATGKIIRLLVRFILLVEKSVKYISFNDDMFRAGYGLGLGQLGAVDLADLADLRVSELSDLALPKLTT